MRSRRQIYRYRGDRCARCGLSVQEMVERYGSFHRLFEFHHVDPSDKHPHYRNLIRRSISTEKLDELDKCILLCRQCHGLVHSQFGRAKLALTVRAGRRKTRQMIEGSLILDRLDKHAHFLASESLLAVP